MKKIEIKNTKTIEEYIKIRKTEEGTQTCYSYIKICSNPIFDTAKHTFNKYAFIEYLKGIRVPKKIIKQIEEN